MMKNELNLVDILNQENRCAFCNHALVIKMVYLNSYNLKQKFSISNDGVFSYAIVNISLNTTPHRYWLGNDYASTYEPGDEVLHSDKFHFVKECYNCVHRYTLTTSDLVFRNGSIDTFRISQIKFQVHNTKNENFIVSQDYYTNKTKIVLSKLKESYGGILLPDDKTIYIPLINFNFDDPDKIANRINTIITFS